MYHPVLQGMHADQGSPSPAERCKFHQEVTFKGMLPLEIVKKQIEPLSGQPKAPLALYLRLREGGRVCACHWRHDRRQSRRRKLERRRQKVGQQLLASLFISANVKTKAAVNALKSTIVEQLGSGEYNTG